MADLETWRFEGPPVSIEPSARWVRVRAGDTVVADSRRTLLLTWYGPGRMPTYCFPAADVRTDLFQPSVTQPGPDRISVAHDVVVGEQAPIAGAALHFDQPPDRLADLRDHWTFTWDGGLSWFEEAMEVGVHARDPRSRVDAVPSERLVRVERDGEVLAESSRPVAVFETSLPTRWYLPMEDVRTELLEPSDTETRCPYKGTASYYSVRAGDRLHPDLAWTYRDPIPEIPRIKGLVAFFDERVDLFVDGEKQERPHTPWSV
jgi:uncharacterized protein (DUF427 family)